MFSALKQGSVVYVLERANEPTLKVGQVTAVTQPTYGNQFMTYNQTMDISVMADGATLEFKNIPATSSVASHGDVTITETKEQMQTEVENMLQGSKGILGSIDYHKKVVSSCESILRDLDPRMAKEKERDDDISGLKDRVGGMEEKMDQILSLLKNKKD